MFAKKIPTEIHESLIGKTVRKKSNKPFKSGDKVGTVKAIVSHAITGNTAFVMLEDSSEVEAFRCVVVTL